MPAIFSFRSLAPRARFPPSCRRRPSPSFFLSLQPVSFCSGPLVPPPLNADNTSPLLLAQIPLPLSSRPSPSSPRLVSSSAGALRPPRLVEADPTQSLSVTARPRRPCLTRIRSPGRAGGFLQEGRGPCPNVSIPPARQTMAAKVERRRRPRRRPRRRRRQRGPLSSHAPAASRLTPTLSPRSIRNPLLHTHDRHGPQA